MKQIGDSQIHLYQFPQESEINAKLPFAVVGSNCVLDINGEKIRGRRYPWGVVNVSKLYRKKNTFSITLFFFLSSIVAHISNFRWKYLSNFLFLGSGCKLSDPLSVRTATAKSCKNPQKCLITIANETFWVIPKKRHNCEKTVKSKNSKVKHTFFYPKYSRKGSAFTFWNYFLFSFDNSAAELFLNGFMLQVMNLIRCKNKLKLGKALTLTFSRSY